MKKDNRRTFLRQFGLALGAVTIGAGEGPLMAYQKKTGILRPPAPPAAAMVDFRYAPAAWSSPLRPPGPGSRALLSGTGTLFRASAGADSGSVGIFLDGAGQPGRATQHCEEPHVPVVTTTVPYGSASVTMKAFSSSDEDEGVVDNIAITVQGASAPAALRFLLGPGGELAAEIEEDDDLPNGGRCVVSRTGASRRPFLVLGARPQVSRDADALVLTVPVGTAAATSIVLRLPAGEADADDLADGISRLEEREAKERTRWAEWKKARAGGLWQMPGAYGEFCIAGTRILDQYAMAPSPAHPVAGAPPRAPGAPPGLAESADLPDLVDEHFISEAELYLGREKEARARLEAVWSIENDRGLLIGAGGEANTKEMCAAVYSLCRHAELTGDWAMFDQLYPDAFNALDSLKLERDRLAALPEKSANIRRNLLAEGSPGRGWKGTYEELTNSYWALIALKLMLEISDRRFLVKKSEIREFYGQTLLAVNTTARETTRQDPAGYSWFPMVGAPATGGAPAAAARSGLGTLALALFPGLIYKKDERMFQSYPSLVQASLAADVPAGTGPGGADATDPVDAAVVAQSLVWLNLPEDARRMYVGFLNHASSVYTWAPAAAAPAPAGDPVPDLRATAESIRFLRHMMVLEDDGVLRLFDGIAAADLAAGTPLRIENTPTRWGKVSVALDPVDERTWKASYRREPRAEASKPPPLKSIEMPRVLAPNFRFDTVSKGSAMKNGPRVIIDAEPTEWEVMLRNPRR